MFHSGDTVEEIATKRIGKSTERGKLGQGPDSWQVFFSDGKQPLIKDFKRAEMNQLRLVKCPHEPERPGAVPSSWVVG
jgi:hypothetical protein